MTKEVIHTYRKFGSTIEFSVDEKGILLAQVTDESQKREIPFIKGLPAELRSGLLDETKRSQLKKILEDSYFVTIGHEVQVNARVKGGWGNVVHRGIYSMGDEPVYYEGTHKWANDVGFSDGNAMQIAQADAEVDSAWSSTSYLPLPGISDQSWHFNTTSGFISHDGAVNDSRIIHAVECLSEAIDIYRGIMIPVPGMSWQIKLGNGLHALQDVFAHTEKFVGYLNDDGTTRSFADHAVFMGKGHVTDEPEFISLALDSPRSFCDGPILVPENGSTRTVVFSQRYSDTKTATYLYLAIFLCNTLYSDGTHTTGLCNLIAGSGAGVRIKLDSPDKNVHRFHGLLARIAVTAGITVPATIRDLFYPTSPSPSITPTSLPAAPVSSISHGHRWKVKIFKEGKRVGKHKEIPFSRIEILENETIIFAREGEMSSRESGSLHHGMYQCYSDAHHKNCMRIWAPWKWTGGVYEIEAPTLEELLAIMKNTMERAREPYSFKFKLECVFPKAYLECIEKLEQVERDDMSPPSP